MRVAGIICIPVVAARPSSAEISEIGPAVKATVERIGTALVSMFNDYVNRSDSDTPKRGNETASADSVDKASNNTFTTQTFKEVVEKIEDFMKNLT